jgi:hypothetical protein
MKNSTRGFIGLIISSVVSFSSHTFAYNCHESCQDQAGINPLKIPACQAWKVANCFDIPGNVTDPVCSAAGEVGSQAYPAAAEEMKNRSSHLYKRALNSQEKEILRPLFGDLVDQVTLIFGARLMDQIGRGQYRIAIMAGAQTYGYDIYLKYPESYTNQSQAWHTTTVGHELVHTRQFQQRGNSYNRFGRDYFQSWCQVGFSYKNIQMEREAYALEGEISARAEAHRVRTDRPPYPDSDSSGRRILYGLTCIYNVTNDPINYSFHWGNGEWKNVWLQPRSGQFHSWAYNDINENRSPDLEVEFDYDLSTKGDKRKRYRLRVWGSEHNDCARQREREEFQQVNGGRELDLVSYY